MAEGFIEQIVKKTKESEYLRKNYLVKVIPMVNPDGVAIGNYRTNLAGGDLNRNWGGTERRANGMFPEVAAVRGYVSELMKDRKVKIIIDLHGHSKKYTLRVNLGCRRSFMAIRRRILKCRGYFLTYVRNSTLK